MALETLKGVEEIGGFKVAHIENGISKRDENSVSEFPVFVDHDLNRISFKIQDGPIKENGINGCQVDTLLHAAVVIIAGLNEKFHSPDNDMALRNLRLALYNLENRTKDREARGVEGTSND